MPVFYPQNQEYPDLVSRLSDMILSIKARQEAKARQEMLDRIAAEDRSRQIGRENLAQALSLAGLERETAARQDVIPGSGEPRAGEMGPPTEAESAGAQGRFQIIDTPIGKINLGPLKSRTTLLDEAASVQAAEDKRKLQLKKDETKSELEIKEPYEKAADERRAKMQADIQAAIERRSLAVAGMKATKDAEKAAGKLRVEYNKESSKTRERVRAIERGLAMGAPEKPTAVSDYSLVYAFAKASDPGSSVREGEFKGAKTQIGGWPLKAQQFWNDIQTGKMTDQKRQEMIATIQSGLEFERSDLEAIDKHYRELAEIEEVDPARVLGTTSMTPPKVESVKERAFNPATGKLE